jgi:hypothetical protein
MEMKTIKIEDSTLGNDVEIRELTVGQWVRIQNASRDEGTIVLYYMAEMLHVDGQPIGWDGLMAQPMSQINKLIPKVMTLIEREEGNA